MTIPEQAVDAAAKALCCPDCDCIPEASYCAVTHERERVTRMLTAAQPLMGVQRPEDVAHDKAFANGVKACLQRLYAAGARTDEHHQAWEDCEAMWRNRYDAVLALPHTGQPQAPGHTDLMVSPESIDAFLEANPDHERDSQVVKPIGQERS